jgi:hypothetical protein
LQAAYQKNRTRFLFLHQQNGKMPEQRLSAILSNAYYATLWRYASACSFGSGYTYPSVV